MTRFKTYNTNTNPNIKQNQLEKKKNDISPERERERERNTFISSSSNLIQHKIISTSKISQDIMKKFYSLYKPLNDSIHVEDVKLAYGESIEYNGEWNKLKGERHGRGILLINKKRLFLGYWKNDKMNGFGKQINFEKNVENLNDIDIFSENKSYSYFIGEYKDNYREGKGKEFWLDGTLFEGDYKLGQKNGEGILTLPDGSIYKGQFKDGKVRGKGKIVYSDKREYEGEWSNNKFQGKGIFIWPDGRKYTGEYFNNLKDGYGTFEWPNGRKYKGKWTKGRQNSEGEIYDPVTDKWHSGKWYMGEKIKSIV
jgi:hypothetical protein